MIYHIELPIFLLLYSSVRTGLNLLCFIVELIRSNNLNIASHSLTTGE